MIELRKEKYNWEFLFLGANIDAIEVAGNMGIRKERAANFVCDAVGTAVNYSVLDKAISRVRKCKSSEMACAFADGAWKAEIDEDYEARK